MYDMSIPRAVPTVPVRIGGEIVHCEYSITAECKFASVHIPVGFRTVPVEWHRSCIEAGPTDDNPLLFD